ncbi:MAG: hypothetical protein RLZZ579_840 [Actinomycetota bacterium]
MYTGKLLTICIPTYNRKQTIVETLDRVSRLDGFGKVFDILVSDNNSSDGTFVKLQELYSETQNVYIHKQSNNVGFAGNFVWLLNNCAGKYAFILSDEDDVYQEGLNQLIGYLRDESPVFCSPIAEMHFKGWPGRGRSAMSGIRGGDVSSATFYISGLIYSSEAARRFTKLLESISGENQYVFYYPQSAMLALLLQNGSGRAQFIPYILTSQRVVVEGPLPYTSLESRFAQFQDSLLFSKNLERAPHFLVRGFVASEKRTLGAVRWRAGERDLQTFFNWSSSLILAMRGRLRFYLTCNLFLRRYADFRKRGF